MRHVVDAWEKTQEPISPASFPSYFRSTGGISCVDTPTRFHAKKLPASGQFFPQVTQLHSSCQLANVLGSSPQNTVCLVTILNDAQSFSVLHHVIAHLPYIDSMYS